MMEAGQEEEANQNYNRIIHAPLNKPASSKTEKLKPKNNYHYYSPYEYDGRDWHEFVSSDVDPRYYDDWYYQYSPAKYSQHQQDQDQDLYFYQPQYYESYRPIYYELPAGDYSNAAKLPSKDMKEEMDYLQH